MALQDAITNTPQDSLLHGCLAADFVLLPGFEGFEGFDLIIPNPL